MYNKKEWVSDELITKEALNNIENGIEEIDKRNKIYLLELDRWGISNQDISKRSYELNGDNYLSKYSVEEYNMAYNNKYGIQNALNWAHENNYTQVIFPRGTYIYCYEEKLTTPDIYYEYKPEGIIIPSNMIVDLNGSCIRVIFDSMNVNPYDNSIHNSNNPIYKLPGQIFEFNNTCNSTLQNGELIGDIYERSFLDNETSLTLTEKGCEQTYGILFKNQSYFNNINNMKIHGFMGDAVSVQLGHRLQRSVGTLLKGFITDDETVVDTYYGAYYSEKISLDGFNNGFLSTTGFSTRILDLHDPIMEILWFDENNKFISREKYMFKQYVTIPKTAKFIRFQIFNEPIDTDTFSRVNFYIVNMSHHLIIENNEIFNNHRGGISNIPDFTCIRNNWFYHNGKGDKFNLPIFPNATRYQINCEDYCPEGIIIESNKFSDGFHGILMSSTNCKIMNNIFENLGYAVTCYFCYNVDILNNNITSCEYTIELGGNDPSGSRIINFKNNIIRDTGYILLRNKNDNSIINICDNVISGYKWYAELQTTAKINFSNNRIIQNTSRTEKFRLVKFYNDSDISFGNTIELNSSISNGDVSFQFNTKYPSFNYNYITNTSNSLNNIFLHYINKKIYVDNFSITINFRPDNIYEGDFIIEDSIFNDCVFYHRDYTQHNSIFKLKFTNCVFNLKLPNISFFNFIGYDSYDEGVFKDKQLIFENCSINVSEEYNKPIFNICYGFNNDINLVNCNITKVGDNAVNLLSTGNNNNCTCTINNCKFINVNDNTNR